MGNEPVFLNSSSTVIFSVRGMAKYAFSVSSSYCTESANLQYDASDQRCARSITADHRCRILTHSA
jgi:hypothetical protein